MLCIFTGFHGSSTKNKQQKKVFLKLYREKERARIGTWVTNGSPQSSQKWIFCAWVKAYLRKLEERCSENGSKRELFVEIWQRMQTLTSSFLKVTAATKIWNIKLQYLHKIWCSIVICKIRVGCSPLRVIKPWSYLRKLF